MSTIGDVTTIPAGWYPDPADASRSRWWDGSGWTSSISEPQPPAPAVASYVEPQQYVATTPPRVASSTSVAKALTRRELREQSQLALAATGSQPAGPDVIARSAHTSETPSAPRKLPTIEEVIAMAAATPLPVPSVPFDWSPNAVIPTRAEPDVAAPPVSEPAVPAPAASVAEPVITISHSNPLPGMPSYLTAGPPVMPSAPASARPATPAPVAATPAPRVVPMDMQGPAAPVAAPTAATLATPSSAPASDARQQLTPISSFAARAESIFDSPTLSGREGSGHSDASLWTGASHSTTAPQKEKSLTASTFGIWSIAILPLLTTALAWLSFIQLGLDSSGVVRYVLIGAPIALALMFAGLDKRALENSGHARTAPVMLAVLPMVYFIARLVRVGPKTLAPFAVWLVSVGVSAAYVYLELTTFMAALGL